MSQLLEITSHSFDEVQKIWSSPTTRRAIGSGLVVIFLLALLSVEVRRQGLLPPALAEYVSTSHFAAISLAFTALLIVEVIALIFALARSVAESVGVQFQLFSLILLRESFKEVGKLGEPINWATSSGPILHALADAGGALLVFAGVIVYTRLQRHRPITTDAADQAQFVHAKKVLALGLLAAFAVAGVEDLWRVVAQDDSYPFFDSFFTVLIFADVLVVLVSLRYTDTYAVVFRNSGFALATVVLRIALVAPVYVNVALGVGATVFVIALTAAYNRAPLDLPHA